MSAGKKKLIICTIFPALASVVLISAALATHFWVTSSPEKKTSNNGTIGFENSVNFGLFKGHKTINFGIGTRDSDIEVVCVAADAVCAWLSEGDVYLYKTGDVLIKTLLEVHKNTTDVERIMIMHRFALCKHLLKHPGELYEVGLFSYGQWITTIMMAALGIAFGLISVGFAIFNAVGKPIETITGPMGLYLWNGLACFFTILAMVLYLVLFFTTYKKNFLNYDEWKQLRVEGTTNLGYSFFFVVIAMVLYLINIIILFLSGYKLRCSFGSEAEKVVDNGIILF